METIVKEIERHQQVIKKHTTLVKALKFALAALQESEGEQTETANGMVDESNVGVNRDSGDDENTRPTVAKTTNSLEDNIYDMLYDRDEEAEIADRMNKRRAALTAEQSHVTQHTQSKPEHKHKPSFKFGNNLTDSSTTTAQQLTQQPSSHTTQPSSQQTTQQTTQQLTQQQPTHTTQPSSQQHPPKEQKSKRVAVPTSEFKKSINEEKEAPNSGIPQKDVFGNPIPVVTPLMRYTKQDQEKILYRLFCESKEFINEKHAKDNLSQEQLLDLINKETDTRLKVWMESQYKK